MFTNFLNINSPSVSQLSVRSVFPQIVSEISAFAAAGGGVFEEEMWVGVCSGNRQ